MKFSSHEPPKAEFQIAPMIDIVFLLLIFFIVTWNISTQEAKPHKEISLPTSNEGKTTKQYAPATTINLFKDGKIAIDSKIYTEETLKAQMEDTHRFMPDKIITIWADEGATVAQAFTIYNICKSVGLTNVTIAAKQPESL